MTLIGFFGEDRRGDSAQGRVRSAVVIVLSLGRQDVAGVGQGQEQGIIQAFIAKSSVEAFHEGVLLGLARSDVMPCDAGWAATPNPWKQEGTQSCEKRRVTKDLCGISLPQNPYQGFRSDHTELR